MRHKKNTKKFKRTEEQRKRLWQDLSSALILHGQIVTFSARAKWFRPKFERLVTLVKRSGDDTKLAFSKVRPYLSEKVARELIEKVAPKLLNRDGGYTRIIKLDAPFSEHDKSVVSIVEDTQKTAPKAKAATVEKVVESTAKEVKPKTKKVKTETK